MLATSRFWRLTVWGWSLYDCWLTNFWRIWVKWYFIKHTIVAFFFWLIGVRFAFGHWATQAGEPADRTTAGAQHHPHGDYTEVLHCTNNHAVMHGCTSLTHIQSSFLACTSCSFLLGLATSYIFAIILKRVWLSSSLSSCTTSEFEIKGCHLVCQLNIWSDCVCSLLTAVQFQTPWN